MGIPKRCGECGGLLSTRSPVEQAGCVCKGKRKPSSAGFMNYEAREPVRAPAVEWHERDGGPGDTLRKIANGKRGA